MLIATIGLMLVITLVKYVTRKKKPPKSAQQKEMTTWSGLYRFSRAEIENAINYRNEKKCLGRGSAGRVYKGVLPSGQAVAVKHIYQSNTSDSFRREVEGLSRVRHPNLVCLFGYCIEDGEQYLVYEYCPAGNLAYHLRSTSGSTTFLPLISFLFFIRKKGEEERSFSQKGNFYFIFFNLSLFCPNYRERHCLDLGKESQNSKGMRFGPEISPPLRRRLHRSQGYQGNEYRVTP